MQKYLLEKKRKKPKGSLLIKALSSCERLSIFKHTYYTYYIYYTCPVRSVIFFELSANK